MKKGINPKKWIILGIPIIFVIGSLFHFIYDLSSKQLIIGLISPINESIFEHTKLAFIPVTIWWLGYYIFRGNKYKINKNKWFLSTLVSGVLSSILMPMLYYFYKNVLGTEILIVDILILLIVIIIGQLVGLHLYEYGKGKFGWKYSLIIIILVLISYIILTISPPKTPFFKDPLTGTYGLVK